MDSETALALFSKELLSYDSHGGGNEMFYYNLPYKRNYALTTSIPIAPVSGNIIKFYQYQLGKPIAIFTDTVDITPKKPMIEASDEDDEYADGYEEGEEFDENGEPREMTDDEMAALLTADNDGDLSDNEVYDKEPSPPNDSYDNYDEDAYDKEPAGAAEDWEPEEF